MTRRRDSRGRFRRRGTWRLRGADGEAVDSLPPKPFILSECSDEELERSLEAHLDRLARFNSNFRPYEFSAREIKWNSRRLGELEAELQRRREAAA